MSYRQGKRDAASSSGFCSNTPRRPPLATSDIDSAVAVKVRACNRPVCVPTTLLRLPREASYSKSMRPHAVLVAKVSVSPRPPPPVSALRPRSQASPRSSNGISATESISQGGDLAAG
ncbi:hypothetical protein TCAP_05584 [Tolypocladium capitatum]|uniref:Uncharacterized protein n=1 Tax=Tolypocladium capitatum TaxID=45235 RepID=A0A2K3QAA9_9HYPO|nr:hypothetical protein TCAP_05584 [Tolypocladium capitatum]